MTSMTVNYRYARTISVLNSLVFPLLILANAHIPSKVLAYFMTVTIETRSEVTAFGAAEEPN
jgi:hypothetical protein